MNKVEKNAKKAEIISILMTFFIIIIGIAAWGKISKLTLGQSQAPSIYAPDDSLSFPFAMIDSKGELIRFDVDIANTAERAAKVSFSNSYFETGQSMVISRKNPDISSWKVYIKLTV